MLHVLAAVINMEEFLKKKKDSCQICMKLFKLKVNVCIY